MIRRLAPSPLLPPFQPLPTSKEVGGTFCLTPPQHISETNIKFDPKVLEAGTCGLFRAPLHLAAQLMPSMAELIASVPVPNPEDYELDIKVHMLMVGQYPCIPNWHTDMVPRDESGLRFDLIDRAAPPMLLWISDGPCTEFLARPLVMDHRPGSHQEIARFLQRPRFDMFTQSIKPNTWMAMRQDTPHRGVVSTDNNWRVFARVTHRSLAPRRPVTSVIRRHAQVYLNASEFSW